MFLEAKPGFEPGVKALQASALPLGHFAVIKKADSRTGRRKHGAGYGVRTRDLNLGKVARYQLRQARVARNNIGDCRLECKHFFEKISSGAKSVSRVELRE